MVRRGVLSPHAAQAAHNPADRRHQHTDRRQHGRHRQHLGRDEELGRDTQPERRPEQHVAPTSSAIRLRPAPAQDRVAGDEHQGHEREEGEVQVGEAELVEQVGREPVDQAADEAGEGCQPEVTARRVGGERRGSGGKGCCHDLREERTAEPGDGRQQPAEQQQARVGHHVDATGCIEERREERVLPVGEGIGAPSEVPGLLLWVDRAGGQDAPRIGPGVLPEDERQQQVDGTGEDPGRRAPQHGVRLPTPHGWEWNAPGSVRGRRRPAGAPGRAA